MPFESLRLGNIFRNLATVTNPEPEYDIRSRMSELYSPERGATERLNQMFQQFPQRNKPSFLRRIGAALSSISGGPEVGERQLYKPYYEQLEDWKTKIGPVSRAAEIERSTNVNERQFAYQTIATELRNKAIEARERNDERSALIRQQRADVYEYKARNPDFRFDFSGPTVMISDPASGQVTNSKIPTGSLSDTDKIALQQESALEQIGARGRQARELETAKQAGRETIAETRGWKVYNVPAPEGGQKAVKINEITGEVRDLETVTGPVRKPTAGRTDELMPTQVRVGQLNKARELKNTRPDLGKFIRIIGNEFEIDSPSIGVFGGARGPTKQQYDEINQAIYGKATIIKQPGRAETKIPAKGKVRVRAPDGRTGTWDLSKGPIPKGFTQIE